MYVCGDSSEGSNEVRPGCGREKVRAKSLRETQIEDMGLSHDMTRILNCIQYLLVDNGPAA